MTESTGPPGTGPHPDGAPMIALNRVSKVYRVYRRKTDWLRALLLRQPRHQPKPALRTVSLSVARGEVLGLIGRNGAGKSTLLKLIMGVGLPDSGEVRVRGRVTGLLELGTGFNQELSGRANIAFNAALLGMRPDEIAARREAIIAFSELGPAIDDPLRTYSSGMAMRLAFAIAIHAEPACFVVDEALSVGDARFQHKCMQRIRDFKAQGGAIVFVSHDLNAVKMFCDRAVVLDAGAVVAEGDPESAVNAYNRVLAGRGQSPAPGACAPTSAADPLPATDGAGDASEAATAALAHAQPPPAAGYGSGAARLQRAAVRGIISGGPVLASGETADIVIEAEAREALPDATLGILIRDRFGQDIFGTNTAHLAAPLPLAAGQPVRFHFRMAMNLGPGSYSLTVALHRGTDHLDGCYHWCDNLASFEVAGFAGPPFQGVCRLEPTIAVTTPDPAHVSPDQPGDR